MAAGFLYCVSRKTMLEEDITVCAQAGLTANSLKNKKMGERTVFKLTLSLKYSTCLFKKRYGDG